jgi:hypothetical protein
MDDHIISFLHSFEKPEQNFIKDKECLICLEPFDLEANQIVMLPCVCSNSVYHIDCILKLITSGEDKNFCPHCKRKYELSLHDWLYNEGKAKYELSLHNQLRQQLLDQLVSSQRVSSQRVLGQPVSSQPVLGNQILPYIGNNLQIENPNHTRVNNLQLTNYRNILIVHFLSNSIMNSANIVITGNCPEYNINHNLRISILFYYFKLFINFCMLMYLKNNISQINPCLTYTYIFQIVLFGLLIYLLASMKNDIYFIILIVNNVVFGVGDMAFRIIVEHRMTNTVNIDR